jgi:hypothetical protein
VLLPLFATLSAFPGSFHGGLVGHGPTTIGGCSHVTWDEDGPNRLFIRSMPSYDVEDLLGSFWLFVVKLMNQGAARRVISECWDDVGISYTRELVAFLWETRAVISEGFAQLLPAALQIPRVTRTHVHALDVAGEDLSEDIPTMNDVSWQMIKPGAGKIS